MARPRRDRRGETSRRANTGETDADTAGVGAVPVFLETPMRHRA
jgi:hypothetical protein